MFANKTKKSQISVEFVMILAAMLIMFLIIFMAADKRTAEMYAGRTKLYAKMEADKLAAAINSIALAGNGASKIVQLPGTLRDNSAYNISIYPGSHRLEIFYSVSGENDHYSATLLTGVISGTLTNIRYPVNISNVNGGVLIS